MFFFFLIQVLIWFNNVQLYSVVLTIKLRTNRLKGKKPGISPRVRPHLHIGCTSLIYSSQKWEFYIEVANAKSKFVAVNLAGNFYDYAFFFFYNLRRYTYA